MIYRDYEVKDTDVAVIGYACRFPKSNSPEAFWQNLKAGKDCITRKDQPDPRKTYAFGIMEDVYEFEPEAFANHHGPAEAWQVGMLYNLVYNRDCMIHEIVCETGSGAPYDVTKKVMEDFFGEGCYDKAKAYTPINENKAKLAAYCVNDKNFHDSATLCNWMWPMTQSPSKEREYHGDLDLQADFMTAVTGETYTQAGLQEDGARITQMLRAMTAISFQQNCGSANLRQEHDAICDWVFDKDPDFKAFEEGTTKLDRADMEKAKDLFYDIFGWDRTTGVPTRETLEKYDLADMADDLEKRGIYAQNTAEAE